MSDNVLPFTGITCLPEPPTEFLEKAKAWGMERCLVIGFDENGNLMGGASFSELNDMIFLLELFKRNILE